MNNTASPEIEPKRFTGTVQCKDHVIPQEIYIDTGTVVRNMHDDRDIQFVFECLDAAANSHFTSMRIVDEDSASNIVALGAKNIVVDKSIPQNHPLVTGDLSEIGPISEFEIESIANMPIVNFVHSAIQELSL